MAFFKSEGNPVTKRFVQTTLDSYESSQITEDDLKLFGKMLNQYPFRNIKLIVRQSIYGHYIRPQLRFVSHNKAVVEEVKEKLALSPKIDSYKQSWRTTVTKSKQVTSVLEMLLPYLNTEAKGRAELVIEALNIISSTSLDKRLRFLPSRLSEIVGLLTAD